MCKYFIIFFLVFSHNLGLAQLSDNFSDGNFIANPVWEGDVNNFIVNDDLELQLNAPDAGESFLYTSISPEESNEWSFYFRMEFAPSGSNIMRIYFALSDLDLTIADGYYVEVGETGSDDELKFYQLENGSPTLMGSGTMGALATDPSVARVKIVKTAGTWQLDINYDGGLVLTPEITISDANSITDNSYLGLWCKYTATRTDKFFFDDIYSGVEIIDSEGPEIISSSLLSSNSLLLCFDEAVEEIATSDVIVSPSINIASLDYHEGELNKLLISFTEDISGGIDYTLDIPSISDLTGNTSSVEGIIFSRLETPAVGDLIINEVLSDPFPGGTDFIEIYNRSDKTLSLSGLVLINGTNGNFEVILGPNEISPDEYIAFTEDKDFLDDNYTLLNPDAVHEMDLPSYNNDEGNVSLLYFDGTNITAIDSFNYTSELHSTLLSDTEGVSLERLSSEVATNSADNWNSASEFSGYATPGYENSNRISSTSGTDIFSLDKKVFSPDGDGFEDLLIINYTLPSTGYSLSVNIYDAEGKFIRNLAESALPSVSGIVKWDGTVEEGTLASMGIYIAHFSGFHPDGDRLEEKLVFAIAEVLD